MRFGRRNQVNLFLLLSPFTIFAPMKKLIYTIVLFLCPLLSTAQIGSRNFGAFGEGGMPQSTNSQDSVKEVNVPHVRRAWQWQRVGVYSTPVSLDTLLDGIHNFNPIFKKSISNT